jgi:hypothetical protein
VPPRRPMSCRHHTLQEQDRILKRLITLKHRRVAQPGPAC